jgi:hypothetical protein
MTQYMLRIASHTQLSTITALQIIQYIASEMCIQYSSKQLCSLEENLLTSGGIPVSRNEVRS